MQDNVSNERSQSTDNRLNYARVNYILTLKDLQVLTAEMVGTFYLALVIAATKVTVAQGSQALAIGFGLVSLVYMTGSISGGTE